MEQRVEELENKVHALETDLAVSQSKAEGLDRQVTALWDKYDAVQLVIAEVREGVTKVHQALLQHIADEASKQNVVLWGVIGTFVTVVCSLLYTLLSGNG